jgi:hypothetical protein
LVAELLHACLGFGTELRAAILTGASGSSDTAVAARPLAAALAAFGRSLAARPCRERSPASALERGEFERLYV